MTLQQVLRTLLARGWVAVAVLAGVVALAAAYTQLQAPRYSAAATLIVDLRPPALGAAPQIQLTDSYMATQLDVIRSENVALRVVDRLRLTEDPALRARFRDATAGDGSLRQWLAGAIRRSLDVEPSRESRLVTLRYEAPDPRQAALMANAFAESYMQANLELSVAPAQRDADWFEGQLEALRERLEQAQAKLSGYQREQGLFATDERLDVETQRLGDLSRQLLEAEGLRHDADSRAAEMLRLRGAGGSLETLREATQSAVVQGIKSDLARLGATLAEQAQQLGPSHPRYRRTEAEIAELRARLGQEIASIARALTENAELARAREASLRKELDAQRARVMGFKTVRDELPALEREVASAQAAYEAALSRFNQSRLEGRMADATVTLLSAATPPLDPSGPNLIRNLLIATLLGGALGVGLALGWEALDRRVRAVADLAEGTQAPVLAMLAWRPA